MFPVILTVLNRDYSTPYDNASQRAVSIRGEHPNLEAVKNLIITGALRNSYSLSTQCFADTALARTT